MARMWWKLQEVCSPASPRAGGRAGAAAEGLCSWQMGSESSCACHIPSPITLAPEILPQKLPVSGEILRGVFGSFFFPLGVVRVLEGERS